MQALLNPLQKNPAMGPRVLAKRLIIVQCRRNGEGEPEREKEVTAMIATMTTITTMTTMTDRGTKTADQSSAGMGSEQGRMSDRGGTAGTAGRGLTMVLRRVARHNNLTTTISS